jgi:hypothetical protein
LCWKLPVNAPFLRRFACYLRTLHRLP